MENLIYALKCPITKEIHYVGKSTQGMRRPMEHMTDSHSDKIKEWVNDLSQLNHKPEIVILEELEKYDDIERKEQIWISKCLDNGCFLLNVSHIIPSTIRTDLPDLLKESAEADYKAIGEFISHRRKLMDLTQTRFAELSCVALCVIRKIEQGKTNINLAGLLTALSMFGYTLTIKKIQK